MIIKVYKHAKLENPRHDQGSRSLNHDGVVNQQGIIAHDPNPNQTYLGTDIFKIQGDVFVDVIKKKEVKK